MAGGPHARFVPCMHCFSRAERTYEGLEDDHYTCERGHRFGVDWSHGGPPQRPCWPPTAAEREAFERLSAMRRGDDEA